MKESRQGKSTTLRAAFNLNFPRARGREDAFGNNLKGGFGIKNVVKKVSRAASDILKEIGKHNENAGNG